MADKEPLTILTPAGASGGGQERVASGMDRVYQGWNKKGTTSGMVVETCRDMPETQEELLAQEREGQG
jgi:hypothetical protein